MRVGTLLGMAVGLAACAESPVAPLRVLDQPPSLAVTSNSQWTTTFSRTLWVSCAGESVALLGQLEFLATSTEDENGGVHTTTHVRPSGVVGVGLTSGQMYRGTGGTFVAEGDSPDGYPATYTFVNNFRIIGQGPGNNLLMHMTIHETVNANGDLTADVDLSAQDCR